MRQLFITIIGHRRDHKNLHDFAKRHNSFWEMCRDTFVEQKLIENRPGPKWEY